MFIAMNRFKIKPGHEEDFLEVWRSRDTHLQEVPGFKQFNLLQGATTDEHTLFASHSEWESREAFEKWTQSEAFRKAHASAGARKDIYLGPPQFEGFEVKL
ncbi:antibiotic biosynthesis monooxygenase family protein [Salinisphaera aquimarina]|uniref:Antibiotic biosynthesis monooxygenase family protein n=1 Tax=Salinisphaera aquimarina TaxID=2094031 RepID=A0ABV7EI33_9GAMM